MTQVPVPFVKVAFKDQSTNAAYGGIRATLKDKRTSLRINLTQSPTDVDEFVDAEVKIGKKNLDINDDYNYEVFSISLGQNSIVKTRTSADDTVYPFEANKEYSIKLTVSVLKNNVKTYLNGYFTWEGAVAVESYSPFIFRDTDNSGPLDSFDDDDKNFCVLEHEKVEADSDVKMNCQIKKNPNHEEKRDPSYLSFSFDYNNAFSNNITVNVEKTTAVKHMPYSDNGLYTLPGADLRLVNGSAYTISVSAYYSEGNVFSKTVKNNLYVFKTPEITHVEAYGLGDYKTGAGAPPISTVANIHVKQGTINKLPSTDTVTFGFSQGGVEYYTATLKIDKGTPSTYGTNVVDTLMFAVEKAPVGQGDDVAGYINKNKDTWDNSNISPPEQNEDKSFSFDMVLTISYATLASDAFGPIAKSSVKRSDNYTSDITPIVSVYITDAWMAATNVDGDEVFQDVDLTDLVTKSGYDNAPLNGIVGWFKKNDFFNGTFDTTNGGLFSNLDVATTQFKYEISVNGGSWTTVNKIRQILGNGGDTTAQQNYIAVIASSAKTNADGKYANIPGPVGVRGSLQEPVYFMIPNDNNALFSENDTIKVRVSIHPAKGTTLPPATESNSRIIVNKIKQYIMSTDNSASEPTMTGSGTNAVLTIYTNADELADRNFAVATFSSSNLANTNRVMDNVSRWGGYPKDPNVIQDAVPSGTDLVLMRNLDSVYADGSPAMPPFSSFLSKGWYYDKSSAVGTKKHNWYLPVPAGLKVRDIKNFQLRCNLIDVDVDQGLGELPFYSFYTKQIQIPGAEYADATNWFRSVVTYSADNLPGGSFTGKYSLLANVDPNTSTSILPADAGYTPLNYSLAYNSRFPVKDKGTSSEQKLTLSGIQDEEIMYLVVSSNSVAAVHQEYFIENLYVQINDRVRNYQFLGDVVGVQGRFAIPLKNPSIRGVSNNVYYNVDYTIANPNNYSAISIKSSEYTIKIVDEPILENFKINSYDYKTINNDSESSFSFTCEFLDGAKTGIDGLHVHFKKNSNSDSMGVHLLAIPRAGTLSTDVHTVVIPADILAEWRNLEAADIYFVPYKTPKWKSTNDVPVLNWDEKFSIAINNVQVISMPVGINLVGGVYQSYSGTQLQWSNNLNEFVLLSDNATASYDLKFNDGGVSNNDIDSSAVLYYSYNIQNPNQWTTQQYNLELKTKVVTKNDSRSFYSEPVVVTFTYGNFDLSKSKAVARRGSNIDTLKVSFENTSFTEFFFGKIDELALVHAANLSSNPVDDGVKLLTCKDDLDNVHGAITSREYSTNTYDLSAMFDKSDELSLVPRAKVGINYREKRGAVNLYPRSESTYLGLESGARTRYVCAAKPSVSIVTRVNNEIRFCLDANGLEKEGFQSIIVSLIKEGDHTDEDAPEGSELVLSFESTNKRLRSYKVEENGVTSTTNSSDNLGINESHTLDSDVYFEEESIVNANGNSNNGNNANQFILATNTLDENDVSKLSIPATSSWASGEVTILVVVSTRIGTDIDYDTVVG